MKKKKEKEKEKEKEKKANLEMLSSGGETQMSAGGASALQYRHSVGGSSASASSRRPSYGYNNDDDDDDATSDDNDLVERRSSEGAFRSSNREKTMTSAIFSETEEQATRTWRDLVRPPSRGLDKGERRSLLLKNLILVSIAFVMALAVFVICSVMYFGSAWKPTTARMSVIVIQSDPGLPVGAGGATLSLGAAVVDALVSVEDGEGRPLADWKVIESPGVELIDSEVEKVEDESDWAVIQTPANMTLTYVLAMQGFLSEYNNSMQVVVNQGKQPPSARALSRVIDVLLDGIDESVALQAAQGAFGKFDLNRAVPAAVVQPVPFDVEEIYVPPYGTNFAIAMGLVFMWASTASLVSVTFQLTEPLEEYYAPLFLAGMRWIIMLVQGFLMALTYTLILLGFGTGFAEGFGRTWMFAWLIFCCFQAIIIFFFRALGPIGSLILTPLLILQIVLGNTFVDTVMLGSFYQWGDGLPFTHAYEGLRSVIIGSPQCCGQLGINVAVLIAWGIAFTILAWLLWFFRVSAKLTSATSPDTSAGRILLGLTSNRNVEFGFGGAASG
jgi:Protein of unknown function (DUF3533)